MFNINGCRRLAKQQESVGCFPVRRATLYFLMIQFALDLIRTLAQHFIKAESIVPDSINGFPVPQFSFSGILILLVTLLLSAGYDLYMMGIFRGEDTAFETIFDAFSMAGKLILLYVLEFVFISLWSMLFVIPGLIAVYRYRFAVYNLLRDPELSAMQAITLSCRQSAGHKAALFLLDVSFWPYILGISALNTLFGVVLSGFFPMNLLGDLSYLTLISASVGAVQLFFLPYYTLADLNAYAAIMRDAAAPPPSARE